MNTSTLEKKKAPFIKLSWNNIFPLEWNSAKGINGPCYKGIAKVRERTSAIHRNRPGLQDTGLLFASDWFRQNRAVFITVTPHRIPMNSLLIAVKRR